MIFFRGVNPTKAKLILQAEKNARTWVPWAVDFVRDHLPGCKNLKLDSAAPCLALREGRRIHGQHTLKIDEMAAGMMFSDRIALGARSVDLHDPTPNHRQPPESNYLEFKQPYSIPWRSLLPLDTDNLILAGRCISVDYPAFGSTRMMAQCMATGEAAGTGAALCVLENTTPSELNVNQLQEALRKQGARLE
jgi:hypothetical protein